MYGQPTQKIVLRKLRADQIQRTAQDPADAGKPVGTYRVHRLVGLRVLPAGDETAEAGDVIPDALVDELLERVLLQPAQTDLVVEILEPEPDKRRKEPAPYRARR